MESIKPCIATSSLHAIDVNGREVNGFPLSLEQGQCSAWALVDYDNDGNTDFVCR